MVCFEIAHQLFLVSTVKRQRYQVSNDELKELLDSWYVSRLLTNSFWADYQYKLKIGGKHSTLTDARQSSLQALGFVWDSHKATWMERYESLKEFKSQNGHCDVPANYPDKALAIWVKVLCCRCFAMLVDLLGGIDLSFIHFHLWVLLISSLLLSSFSVPTSPWKTVPSKRVPALDHD